MDKKLTIRESFHLGKGWNLMFFAILAMLVTNAGVNDGLNIALPAIAEGAGPTGAAPLPVSQRKISLLPCAAPLAQ